MRRFVNQSLEWTIDMIDWREMWSYQGFLGETASVPGVTLSDLIDDEIELTDFLSLGLCCPLQE